MADHIREYCSMLNVARSRQNKSQSMIAKEIGVKASTIKGWENDGSAPSEELHSRLLRAYGLDEPVFLEALRLSREQKRTLSHGRVTKNPQTKPKKLIDFFPGKIESHKDRWRLNQH